MTKCLMDGAPLGGLRLWMPALLSALLLLGGERSPAGVSFAAQAAQPILEQGQADIEGPMPPLDLPAAVPAKRHPAHRVVAVAVAVGFALLVWHYLRHRRRVVQRRRAQAPALAAPAEDVLALPDGEFYARLIGMLRDALDAEAGSPVAAMTPRELACLDLGGVVGQAEGSAAALRELCARAERAEYARAEIEAGLREADLRFVREFADAVRRRSAGREVRQ